MNSYKVSLAKVETVYFIFLILLLRADFSAYFATAEKFEEMNFYEDNTPSGRHSFVQT